MLLGICCSFRPKSPATCPKAARGPKASACQREAHDNTQVEPSEPRPRLVGMSRDWPLSNSEKRERILDLYSKDVQATTVELNSLHCEVQHLRRLSGVSRCPNEEPEAEAEVSAATPRGSDVHRRTPRSGSGVSGSDRSEVHSPRLSGISRSSGDEPEGVSAASPRTGNLNGLPRVSSEASIADSAERVQLANTATQDGALLRDVQSMMRQFVMFFRRDAAVAMPEQVRARSEPRQRESEPQAVRRRRWSRGTSLKSDKLEPDDNVCSTPASRRTSLVSLESFISDIGDSVPSTYAAQTAFGPFGPGTSL